VAKLVAGLRVFICDRCVEVAARLMEGPPAESRLPQRKSGLLRALGEMMKRWSVVAVSGLAALGVGPVGARPPSTQPATVTAYVRPELLVSTDWLAAHLDDPPLRIVDLQRSTYGEGHIPGAVFLANEAIRDAASPPTFLPPAGAFERLMGSLGISNRTRVVAYDERGGIYAARLWWILNYFGHSNVALLDGGLVKWRAEGRALTKDPPAAAAATFTARPDPRWLATASDVVDAIGKPGIRIVDARTMGEIEGKDLRGIRRGGAIPSSIPVYWEDALDPVTKAFKPAADLARLYREKGVLPEHEVITYCQIGMRASHDLFVLRLLGYERLRNYYGAWEEWGNRDDLPIRR
jgi:thiosulfate/3-mercaptopyruvate sulfurtransferase